MTRECVVIRREECEFPVNVGVKGFGKPSYFSDLLCQDAQLRSGVDQVQKSGHIWGLRRFVASDVPIFQGISCGRDGISKSKKS